MNNSKKEMSTSYLVIMSLFTAIVAVLSIFGGSITIGGLATINLTLVPIVLGAAICGPIAGGFLGGVSGFIILVSGQAAPFFVFSIPGTIITVMVKGIASGLAAGYIYELLKNRNKYVAVAASAVICPIVNTGLYLLGSLIFFMDSLTAGAAEAGVSVAAYMLLFFVSFNFLLELLVNIILAPAIVRIIDIAKKKFPTKR